MPFGPAPSFRPSICYVKFTCNIDLFTVILDAMTIRRYHAILLGAVLLLSGAVSYSSWEPHPFPLQRPEIGNVPRHPWIALTFDDGPHAVMTERLLDTLKDEGVPGTFFIVGKMAVRYPEIVQEIARQGHEVANHTFSHPNLARADGKTVLNELAQTRSIIQKLTGQDTVLYRPPGGDYSRLSLKVASKAGYHMILWTVLTKDVNGTSVPVMQRHILNNAADGAIVLMHSGIPNTIAMLPGVIEELRREGYHFVTVSQLIGLDRTSGVSQPPLPDSAVYPIASR
jgi:peptidoglycan/xylan/chitin deacetylase (PgdA/CDA1 family)